MPTELGFVTDPDAVLCRTNVGAMTQVMTLLAGGHRVGLVGGGGGLRALTEAARDLNPDRLPRLRPRAQGLAHLRARHRHPRRQTGRP